MEFYGTIGIYLSCCICANFPLHPAPFHYINYPFFETVKNHITRVLALPRPQGRLRGVPPGHKGGRVKRGDIGSLDDWTSCSNLMLTGIGPRARMGLDFGMVAKCGASCMQSLDVHAHFLIRDCAQVWQCFTEVYAKKEFHCAVAHLTIKHHYPSPTSL